jgi:hypothetical protein
VYDNRNQERAIRAMRQAQARRRSDTLAPSVAVLAPLQQQQVQMPSSPAAGAAGAAAASRVVHNTASSPAASSPAAAAGAAAPPARSPSPPAARRGPVNEAYLTSSEVAAGESTGALRARWSLVYGRKCNSYNVKYLRKAVVWPGVDVGPKRARPKAVVAVTAADDDANDADHDEEEACELSSETSDGSDVYSVVDSLKDGGDEWMVPPEEEGDAQVVCRRAAEESSEEEDSSGPDSDDARELQALVDKQRLARKAKRHARRSVEGS